MKKKTIAEKRAILYREWLLAKLANDECYYDYTLALGIPDGDEDEDVLWDLEAGWYDDDIDDTINVYLRAKKHYGEGGYYVREKVIMDEDMALYEAGYGDLPKRIYKKHGKWDKRQERRINMYSEDYLCPICGEPLYELVNHDLVCENCNMTFESWECSSSMRVIMEDSREQKTIDRFYGLED